MSAIDPGWPGYVLAFALSRHVLAGRASAGPKHGTRRRQAGRKLDGHRRTDARRCTAAGDHNHAVVRHAAGSDLTDDGYREVVTGVGQAIKARSLLRHRGLVAASSQHQLGHFGTYCVVLIRRQCYCGQDTDDGYHDHQFDERKALLNRSHCMFHRFTPAGRK